MLPKVGTPDQSQKTDFLGHHIMINRHDPVHSKLVEIECNGQDGGKIVEKANAGSNVSDTRLNYNPVANPWTLKSGQNSIVLSMTYNHKALCTKACYTRDRYYSTYRKDIASQP